jgi:hypothetical protein
VSIAIAEGGDIVKPPVTALSAAFQASPAARNQTLRRLRRAGLCPRRAAAKTATFAQQLQIDFRARQPSQYRGVILYSVEQKLLALALLFPCRRHMIATESE